MKKCPPPVRLHGHDIRITRRRGLGLLQFGGVDSEPGAKLEDPGAIIVRTDQSDAGKRERGPHQSEIDEDVEWGAAGAFARRKDVGQRVLLRPGVDDLDRIHDPVAAGENATARSAHAPRKKDEARQGDKLFPPRRRRYLITARGSARAVSTSRAIWARRASTD